MATGAEGPVRLDRRLSQSSAEGIKSLNCELREHLTRLRSRLELQRGSVKQIHWQKVLDARAIREQEQQKAAAALHDLRVKQDRERLHDLSTLRESLVQRYEGELQKLQRHKEAEITKLRLDLDSKEGVIRRLIADSRRTSLRSSIDGHKTRLVHELSELRSAKKELEDLLESARCAQRNHGDELRKQEEVFQAEVARVKRDSQCEIRQLTEGQLAARATRAAQHSPCRGQLRPQHHPGLALSSNFRQQCSSMEPCRSVSARVPLFRSPASTSAAKPRSAVSSVTAGPLPLRHLSDHYATEDTLKHLISTIEQLKSKDKVISQLERELGHPAAFAGPVSMATEVTRTPSSGQHSNKMETPPLSPHKVLSGLSQVFQTLHGTTVASFPLGGEEKGAVEVFAGLEAELQGLHDRAQALALDRQTLLDKVKECEAKNKQLVERNRRFLEKNVELTAQNRSLKDGNHTLQQQHKKTRDEAEEGRRKLCELARELQRVKGHNLELEAQVQQMEELKTQLADQTASITLLRQACTDKDRRIELIQHRKKRRRLIRSQEKCQGVKETFYGYDDDENDVSIDSENSQSSVSVSTISEEDACDELSREELERSHRQMLREHLQLERSHALLQAHAGSSQDPYRELQTRSQLQADLFSAQCRVELLEKEIRSLQSSARRRRSSGAGVDADVDVDVRALLTEREELLAARYGLRHKLEQVDGECARLRQELRQAEERAEDLEFRMLELEENRPSDDQHSQDDDLHLHHGNDLDKHDLDGHDLDENVHHRDDEARDRDGAQKVSSMSPDATKLFTLSSLCDNVDTIMAALTAIVLVFPAW